MKVSDLPAPPETLEIAPPAPAPARAVPWGRVALVCAVLVGSGALRAWQDYRIRRDLKRGLDSPVSLKSLPMEFGPWKGEDTPLDPLIARGTGADQVVTRRYTNQNTGVRVEVILLFGPAREMYIHTPELCYPKAGYTQAAGPEEVKIQTGPGRDAPFRELVYSKGEGGLTTLQEVVYSWRYNGKWTPNVGVQKHFERISGMYKVHVARGITEQELKSRPRGAAGVAADDPCRVFLDQLLPQFEAKVPGPTG
jgi:Protein of unknown function (DUF3485)